MKLSASCTPFEALPDTVWQSFKRQVQEAAKAWGIEIAISQDLTVGDANQRFWDMQRVMRERLGSETPSKDG